ncbi:tryptophan synthase subunit alpha [candidate division KSB1 bacterium]|nr:tryptophan synthase subunit alpha [candidate division KSB1 bacterium]NIR68943.1 tryptophan synthase subunit alpha [candidate division KSB1 bacterium]NIS27280.1 tryptophan synthase subunit alpha [candidate division KSB1 bacterium]NIT74159.1 tryptophan synthase subunit alpha [candidate division KSB1 bacterium]NIU28010.1 tryptophan synthase subunit alpha [candidate division KSB1 bacterium]
MSRLQQVFKAQKTSGKKLFSAFVTAGFPDLKATPELVWTLESAGADLVEIGIPFSDALADGPTIQKASQIALQNGVSLNTVLDQVHKVRQRSEVPIVLMGYLSPILKYGLNKFMKDARSAGADGLIIPDLIPEEWLRLGPSVENTLGINFLIAPNTPLQRIEMIDQMTSDFIYCVSVTGVTGARSELPSGLRSFLDSVNGHLNHPYLVGFGISTPEQAKQIAQHSHGVIVGSAIIKLIEKHQQKDEMLDAVRKLVCELKTALEGV